MFNTEISIVLNTEKYFNTKLQYHRNIRDFPKIPNFLITDEVSKHFKNLGFLPYFRVSFPRFLALLPKKAVLIPKIPVLLLKIPSFDIEVHY